MFRELSFALGLMGVFGTSQLFANTKASCCNNTYTCCTYEYINSQGQYVVPWSNQWVQDGGQPGCAPYSQSGSHQDEGCNSASIVYGSNSQILSGVCWNVCGGQPSLGAKEGKFGKEKR